MLTHPHQQVIGPSSIDILGRLMRSEQAAAETYRQAQVHLGAAAPPELDVCLRSHDLRATDLAGHITLAGGTPTSGNGTWNDFAQVVERGTDTLAAQAVFAALEEGEDQSLAEYRDALPMLDAVALGLVRGTLLPEQIRTHGIMSALCRPLA